MKKIFYFNGCSQVAGNEAIEHNPTASESETKLITWPVHFTKLINPDGKIINDSQNGASNDRIFRTTVDWVSKNADKSQESLVVIMWTEPNRFEFQQLDSNLFNAISGSTSTEPEKKYLINFAEEYLAGNHLNYAKNLNQMLSLEYLLRSLNFDFIFVNAFSFSKFFPLHELNDSSFKKLTSMPTANALLNDEFCFKRTLINNNFRHTKGLHFFEDAHRFYGKFLYERLLK